MARNRDENKRKGMAFLREGNLKAANDCFQRAVEVTTEMAVQLIRVCKSFFSVFFLHLIDHILFSSPIGSSSRERGVYCSAI